MNIPIKTLAEPTLDLTKPLQTRHGDEVCILATDAIIDGKTRIVGIHDGTLETWDAKTGFFFRTGEESGMDLINARTKKSGFVNLYRLKDGETIKPSIVRESDRAARSYVDEALMEGTYIGTFLIGWEE